MELISRSGDLKVDAWLEEFIRTTVQFAVWRAPKRVDSVCVSLRRRPGGAIACELTATQADGTDVSASGVDRQAFEAIQIAADRLEVSLFGPISGSGRGALRPCEAA